MLRVGQGKGGRKMADPLDSARRKLARAQQHIGDLETQLKRLFEEQPCTNIVEVDAHGQYKLFKVRFKRPIPDTTYDAVQNLRDALDHAGYGIAVASGKTSPLHTNFPFAPDLAKFEQQVGGRCKDLPDEIVSLFRSFRPYKGGNDLIWALNRVAVTNKHMLVNPMVAASQNLFINTLSIGGGTVPFGIGEPARWDSTKNEITVMRLPADAQVQANFGVSVFIAFGEIDVVSGEPVDVILHTFAGEVERVLVALEVETRRIFPDAF